MDYSNITPNSGSAQLPQSTQPAPKAKPAPAVSKSDVVRREASVGKKLYDSFFSATPREVIADVKTNVLRPSIKKILLDFIVYSASMLINGRSTSTTSTWNPYLSPLTNVINYNAISANRQQTVVSQATNPPSPNGVLTLDTIEFYEKIKAERVMLDMRGQLAAYGLVSVSDYYDFCNVDHDFMTENWGWDNLNGMDVVPSGSMWRIILPPIRPIARRQ